MMLATVHTLSNYVDFSNHTLY